MSKQGGKYRDHEHIELADPPSHTGRFSLEDSDGPSSSSSTKKEYAITCGPQHIGQKIYLSSAAHHATTPSAHQSRAPSRRPSFAQAASRRQSIQPYAEHGPTIDTGDPDEPKLTPANPHLLWSRIRHMIREPLAEFLGVFTILMFGDGVVAQVVLSGGTKGDYQSISWGWGIGVMLGVYVSGLSGAHLNPAVTFANCVYRKFPWRKFPIYLISQFLGGAVGSLVVYANYKSAIDTFEGGPDIRTVPGYSDTATAGIFCTYPAPFMTRTGQFFSEFIASTLLMFLIYALKDDGNLGAGNLTPLGLFFIIFGIGACFGWETGYAINLARDLGPRLMSYFLGYGSQVWSAGNYYFWVPCIAPFFGCLFGGWMYDVLLFTGESPVNTPWLGLKRIISPKAYRQGEEERMLREEQERSSLDA